MSSAQSFLIRSFEGIFADRLPSPIVSHISGKVLEEHLRQNGTGSPPSQSFMKEATVVLNSFLKCDAAQFTTRDEVEVLELKKLARYALKTSFSQLFFLHMSASGSEELCSESDFLVNYPSFQTEDHTEVSLLCKFRNFLVASLRFAFSLRTRTRRSTCSSLACLA